jgi:hypothetical protein
VLGASVLGASVLGASVLGASVLGASVLGASVLGASEEQPTTDNNNPQQTTTGMIRFTQYSLLACQDCHFFASGLVVRDYVFPTVRHRCASQNCESRAIGDGAARPKSR